MEDKSTLYKLCKERNKKRNLKIKIAFEFGLVLSETAKDLKIKITPEISLRAEEILLSEFKINGVKKTALMFTPLILSILEAK